MLVERGADMNAKDKVPWVVSLNWDAHCGVYCGGPQAQQILIIGRQFIPSGAVLYRTVQWFRGGLVVQDHGLLYHSS